MRKLIALSSTVLFAGGMAAAVIAAPASSVTAQRFPPRHFVVAEAPVNPLAGCPGGCLK